MASPPNLVKTLQICQIPPSTDSTESSSEFALPLTYLDLLWFRFPPVERLFFFQLTEATCPFFDSVILPKLKRSLSATLLRFLPVAGRLRWPPQCPKPILLYVPNDGVSVTIAVSDADFDYLSSNETQDSAELHPYIPELLISETEASVLALQITLFPNKGIVVGYAIHHAVLDGKSISIFMKSWAYMCKNSQGEYESFHPPLLPEEFAPVFDRNDVKDPSGYAYDMLILESWGAMDEKNPRNFKLLPHIGVTSLVLSTFELTRADIDKLREIVILWHTIQAKNVIHLSTFVLVFAYVLVCYARTKGWESDAKIPSIVVPVDFRTLLEPPLPTNYFGNCIGGRTVNLLARDFKSENAVSIVAGAISNMIKEVRKSKTPFEDIEEVILSLGKLKEGVIPPIGVAGSTRFGFYGVDFGWGRPKKVEVSSIDRTGAISINESRDGSGGVEVGLALERHEMELFASLFVNGLKDS